MEPGPSSARPRLTIHAGPRSLPELLDLAAAASRSGTRLSIVGTGSRPIEDLVRLAVAGGESVTFGADLRSLVPPEEADARPPGTFRRLLSRFAV